MIIVLSLVGLYLVSYAALALLLYFLSDRLLFPATRELSRTPADAGVEFQDLTFLSDGERTGAWFIPAEKAKGTILFSHGNGGTLSNTVGQLMVFCKLGYNVVAYDYGGYGRSSGNPSESRCYADIRAAWSYLTEVRQLPPDKIVLIGHSLGGGVTAQLASEVTPAAVVLQSTFVSFPRVIQDHVRIFWVIPFVRSRFATINKLEKFTAPVLIVHSSDDTLIPIHHARRLHDRAKSLKQFLIIHGGHNEGVVSARDTYEKTLAEFLGPLLG